MLLLLSLRPSQQLQDNSDIITQTVGGFVAAKGDFKGEKQETEDAKKEALTGADIVIIPAGVPRTV